ncbi:alanyl-tRNA editing protein [Pelagibacterium luteolum]|uniref:Alanine--tRNA ligase n=1 Tax=Pelagibacterium luteolum TaxID=440168 RepID=A0A1G7WBE5_9HYPH|nr:alanyl-tRNA editing protein [Pelagibacterium luteolum]SDG69292.1 misacylated tRNA(Ala) deacylase [Pelagibacterium luteolum]
MTEFLFRSDAYLQTATANVVAITSDGGIILDRTIFYASSGGQPGDTGTISVPDGSQFRVTDTIHPDGDKTTIVHKIGDHSLQPGDSVALSLDWERRYALMRTHSALHLLSVVFPFAVTGGSIGEDKGRLDFDMPEVPEDIAALETRLNDWVAADMPITTEWITDAELAAAPEMIKTMKVKPPMGQGRVRLVRIGDIDLQPCGGTHVCATGEIGPLRIGKIEKKGKQNRRVALHFA